MVMLWAAFLEGWRVYLEAFADHMLSPRDVAVDSHTAPTHLTIHLKQSKTDPFSVGTTLHARV
jgi:hypothetical protein